MKNLLLAFAVTALALMATNASAITCPPGQHPVCDDSGGAPKPADQQACGETDILGDGTLEIAGCANQDGISGCIAVAETVGIGGSADAPIVGDEPSCDAAADAACDACGCAVCAADGPH